jgi:hypothetical protein
MAGSACVTSLDCGGALVCGYDPKDGCDAQGECVAQVSGPAGPPACGCDGSPAQYVAPGFTSVPVASAEPCDFDAGEAGTDADAEQADDGSAGDAKVRD